MTLFTVKNISEIKNRYNMKSHITIYFGLGLITLFGGIIFLISLVTVGNCDSPSLPNVNWTECVFIGQDLSKVNLEGDDWYSISHILTFFI